jgi:hypothetical protein
MGTVGSFPGGEADHSFTFNAYTSHIFMAWYLGIKTTLPYLMPKMSVYPIQSPSADIYVKK